MTEYIIDVERLSYSYPRKSNVLIDVSFKVKKGEVLGIIGPNGAGKSTLCKALNGLVPHFYGGKFAGKVIVAGMNTLEHSVAELATKVGLVFQDPEEQLSGVTLTVYEEVAFGLSMLGFPKEEIDHRVREAIKKVGLEGLEWRSPFELSGGQTQRLAIATALALEPEVLVLDEPTAQLDPIGKFEVFSVIKKLADEGSTIVVVEHEIEELATFADNILMLNEGRVVAYGPARRVLTMVEELKKYEVNPPSVTELTYLLNKTLGTKLEVPITLEEAIKIYGEALGVM